VRACLFCLKNEEKYSFLVLAAFFVNDRSECSKIETNRVKSKRDDVSTFIKFSKTRLLIIALNVLPRFETNYS